MKKSAVSALLVFAACVSPTFDANRISIEETAYGLYVADGESQIHATTTLVVPCDPGARFGAEVHVALTTERRVRVPLQAELRQPAVPGYRESKLQFLPDPLVLPQLEAELDVSMVLLFEGEQDLVDGDYVFRLFNPDDDQTLWSRKFVLEGCR